MEVSRGGCTDPCVLHALLSCDFKALPTKSWGLSSPALKLGGPVTCLGSWPRLRETWLFPVCGHGVLSHHEKVQLACWRDHTEMEEQAGLRPFWPPQLRQTWPEAAGVFRLQSRLPNQHHTWPRTAFTKPCPGCAWEQINGCCYFEPLSFGVVVM